MRRFIVWGMGGVVLVSLAGCFHLFEPRKIKAVKPEAWAQLRIGMTKQEVVKLLGESPSGGGPFTAEACGKKMIPLPEFWEYNWTDGMPIVGPSDKAFAVYFDAAGKVSGFRAAKGAPELNLSTNVPPSLGEMIISPHEADLVVLANVRIESSQVHYIIDEVWKGVELLPPEYKPKFEGKEQFIEPHGGPGTVYQSRFLLWYTVKPGSTNILTDPSCRFSRAVEWGKISSSWPGATSENVSIRQLRKEIAR